MTTRIGLILCALAVVPGGMFVRAADPAESPGKGKVLLLENERILEGDIERVDDQYHVRRAVGETRVPASRVLCLCQTCEEAYAYLRARANLKDPDERLRLAKWCHLHELREQALAEVTAAAQLRPDHAMTQRLLANLQRSASSPPAPRPAQPSEEPEPEPPPASPVDVTQESLGQFVTRVQPILLNACASCHASGRGGNFKLVRPHGSETAGRKTLQHNLAATLAQINLEQPQASPLLTKAVSVHGEMKDPPLRGRQIAAFKSLEDWVKVTLASNPQLRPTQVAATAAFPPTPARPGTEPQPVRPVSTEENATPPPHEPPPTPGEQPQGPPPGTIDPYDPAIFNQQVHPEKK
jgi:hypothetical protein